MNSLRIPIELRNAIPQELPLSTIIRNLLDHAQRDPMALPTAIFNRSNFDVPECEEGRYGIYLPQDEARAATRLGRKYLMSLNSTIQVLLEDTLFRAGKWPPAPER